MKVWPVLKWMFFITLAIIIATGVGGVWLWKNSDRLVREQALLPSFGRALYDAAELTLSVPGYAVDRAHLRVRSLERSVFQRRDPHLSAGQGSARSFITQPQTSSDTPERSGKCP